MGTTIHGQARVKEMLRDLDFNVWNKANVRYMHALLDAVERGQRFRPHDPQPDAREIMAAYRVTGRKPPERQPGQDDEENE